MAKSKKVRFSEIKSIGFFKFGFTVYMKTSFDSAIGVHGRGQRCNARFESDTGVTPMTATFKEAENAR